MVGVEAEGPVRKNPVQPAMPMVMAIDNPMITTLPMVPEIVRCNKPMVSTTTKNISGTNVEASSCADSAKLVFIITMPDKYTSISG